MRISDWSSDVCSSDLLEVALMKSLAHPKRMRLIALASSIQKAGFDALPLIAIMTFFLGAVVALIGSDLLKTLGASELVVELVGISVIRDFGVQIGRASCRERVCQYV